MRKKMIGFLHSGILSYCSSRRVSMFAKYQIQKSYSIRSYLPVNSTPFVKTSFFLHFDIPVKAAMEENKYRETVISKVGHYT